MDAPRSLRDVNDPTSPTGDLWNRTTGERYGAAFREEPKRNGRRHGWSAWLWLQRGGPFEVGADEIPAGFGCVRQFEQWAPARDLP